MKAYGIAGCKTSHLSDGDVGGGGIRDSERGMALCTCFPKATVVIRVVGRGSLHRRRREERRREERQREERRTRREGA